MAFCLNFINCNALVCWQEGENFVNEDVTIEPFNLDKEREEGYFDENGNYVEYVNRNEIKVGIRGCVFCHAFVL